jgi:transcriptional regulator with XRE-family HTH domain
VSQAIGREDGAGFPERLREIIPANQTLDRFAASIGVATSGLKKWLSGKSAPGFHNLIALSKATGVSIDWLCYEHLNTVADCDASTRIWTNARKIAETQARFDEIGTIDNLLNILDKAKTSIIGISAAPSSRPISEVAAHQQTGPGKPGASSDSRAGLDYRYGELDSRPQHRALGEPAASGYDGFPGAAESCPPPPATDAEIMGRLVEGIGRTFAELGQRLPPRVLGERAANLHDRIVASTTNPVERRGAVAYALTELRTELIVASRDQAPMNRANLGPPDVN